MNGQRGWQQTWLEFKIELLDSLGGCQHPAHFPVERDLPGLQFYGQGFLVLEAQLERLWLVALETPDDLADIVGLVPGRRPMGHAS